MKKLILLAGPLALAACSEAEAPVEEEAVVEEAVAVDTAPGTYDYTTADGAVTGKIVMNEDGTYVDNEVGKDEDTGTWRTGEGQTCFTSAAEGSEEICFTDSAPGEDGAWVSTAADGTAFTVSAAAAEAEAAE